ncbi:MAG: type II secretion system protein [Patescibacteria group bacterium]
MTRKNSGFTLIETLIYLALYGIIIGGTLVSVFNIFESHNRNQAKAMLEEEGAYLIGKIDWALSGANSVDTPTTNKLAIERAELPTNQNPLTFEITSGNLTLTRGTNSGEILNNSNVKLQNLTFTHVTPSEESVLPESLTATFMLIAKTSEGFEISRIFSSTKYLRK